LPLANEHLVDGLQYLLKDFDIVELLRLALVLGGRVYEELVGLDELAVLVRDVLA
jgi:hypothetical protein